MNTRQAIGENNLVPRRKQVLSVGFNQDQTCFAIGYENGFKVYNTDPMDLKVKREFTDENGGIGMVKMLFRTNYLALVGGGKNPKYPTNKAVIWDDLKVKEALTLNFFSNVLNILLSRTRIIVVLNNKIFIHSFSSPPKNLKTYETFDNPLGLAVLSCGVHFDGYSNSSGNTSANSGHLQILAFPARVQGQIQIVDISNNGKEFNAVSIVKAHKSKIHCLAINKNGTMLASASETGTIIRIHSTQTCGLLYEFRRGLDRADIYSMEFSPNGTKLAVLSDKETLHVFNISNNYSKYNKQHLLKSLPGVIKPQYFDSIWSFCSIHLKEEEEKEKEKDKDKKISSKANDSVDRGIIGWSNENSIILLWEKRAKWEKFVIVEKEVMTKDNVVQKKFELIKEGWRSFSELSDH